MRSARLLFVVALLALAPFAFSKGSSGHGGHSNAGRSRGSVRASQRGDRCATCTRNSKGRIARNPAAVREFKKTHPCPGTCKGMVVDHITPLKRGGADSPSNMQWQTKAEAKAKDRIE
jgi:hypothetical protein